MSEVLESDTVSSLQRIDKNFYHKSLYQLCYLLQLRVTHFLQNKPFDDTQFRNNFVRLYKKIEDMPEFVYCFTDLARVFSCFDDNNTFKRINRAQTNNQVGERLSTSGYSIKNTLDFENNSANNQSCMNPSTTIHTKGNQNSQWASSSDGKSKNTSVPSIAKRQIPVIFKPNILRVSEERKKRLSSQNREEKRLPKTANGSQMTSRLKTYENRLFQNLKNEEIKNNKKIRSLKDQLNENYKEAKRKSITSSHQNPSGTSGSKRRNKRNLDMNLVGPRNRPKKNNYVPEIQIKVGVQNNHYSFFNTINESDEDDDKYVTVNVINNKYKFKPSSKGYNLVPPKTTKGKNPRGFPSVSSLKKPAQNLYKRHNLEPPIDLRSTSRRYREMLQTRLNKSKSSRDKSNLRNRS
ncbi:unnamed protein product [Moneuplotes crassus]|uniref:Uncharacterized protein n=1 Tax=Euplotes crassus TaxID=5936 RepID=A0AAD1UQ97_EUPCR|nr:unnamed protein product [Moneuplotes crassus]